VSGIGSAETARGQDEAALPGAEHHAADQPRGTHPSHSADDRDQQEECLHRGDVERQECPHGEK
jgi:hypothetical protein